MYNPTKFSFILYILFLCIRGNIYGSDTFNLTTENLKKGVEINIMESGDIQLKSKHKENKNFIEQELKASKDIFENYVDWWPMKLGILKVPSFKMPFR